MKTVLISIKPKWCELIASGKKTMEVRKTAPKLQTPFKCFIYETAQKYKKGTGIFAYGIELQGTAQGRGKVIGEFVCNMVDKYESEFWNDTPDYMNENHAMEQIRKSYYADPDDREYEEEFDYVTGNEVENPDDCELCKQSCLTYAELRKYVGIGDKTFYGWHISELKIYDKPKELKQFNGLCRQSCLNCKYVKYFDNTCDERGTYNITRPPQSWCYVKDKTKGG